ncbi:hypothetical protein DB346_06030 [Verrucomicrobia bacterium LW23]|nr:hypothetical protein DB346_06030 [Verrucomicrobia bacterium LW23]
MDPTHGERYYKGARFSPVAAVMQATCRDRTFLYCPRPYNAADDHAGLFAEFDLCIPGCAASDFPPGYTEAAVGEGFLKIGVGVLRKAKRPYSLFQKCEVIQAATTDAVWTSDSVSFTQTCDGVNGYAYRLVATVRLSPDTVTVDWVLANTGGKAFRTRQYTHNSLRLDNSDTSPHYVLRFPYNIQPQGLGPQQRHKGNAIYFHSPIPQWVNAVVPSDEARAEQGPLVLTLSHDESRLSAECRTLALDATQPGAIKARCLHTAIHAREAFVAPEQFVEISLAPGQQAAWRRTYTFSAPPPPSQN